MVCTGRQRTTCENWFLLPCEQGWNSEVPHLGGNLLYLLCYSSIPKNLILKMKLFIKELLIILFKRSCLFCFYSLEMTILNSPYKHRALCYKPITPTISNPRQENWNKFNASLAYRVPGSKFQPSPDTIKKIKVIDWLIQVV